MTAPIRRRALIAQTLFNEGRAYVPVDQTLVDDATGAYKEVIEILRPVHELWALTRSGEHAVDTGLIYRPGGEGKDLKFFFHYSHDFVQLALAAGLDTDHITKQLAVLDRLYTTLNQQAMVIAEQLDREYGHVFVRPLTEAMAGCDVQSMPYSTNTLRGLWYPADTKQRGAGSHIDRSAISIPLGDSGGELLALESKDDPLGVNVSPEKGQALVFFGAKILFLSRGILTPLWHRSTVSPEDGDRTAMVQFIHADIGRVVDDANEAWDAFYAEG